MADQATQEKAFFITEVQRDALLVYLQKRPYKEVANGISFLSNAPSTLLQMKANDPAQENDQIVEPTAENKEFSNEGRDSGDNTSSDVDLNTVEPQKIKVFFLLSAQQEALLSYLQDRPYEEVAKGIDFLMNAPVAMLRQQGQTTVDEPFPSSTESPTTESYGDQTLAQSQAV